MRLWRYGAAIVSSSLLVAVLASPMPQHKTASRPSTPDPVLHKYFKEPGGNQQLGHYDARYFHGIVSHQERTDSQLHMIRAYLDFFRNHGLDTWIAHGTLLGWWWNGKRLPWDWDMDAQVSFATLHYLSKNFNQTYHQYVSEDGKTKREYLVDVNPWIWERQRGDGMNVIDARWIDIRNGLYIDITALSETHPETHPGVLSCKNTHVYKAGDLYPMRETVFEGVRAKVPYAYAKVLLDEYHEKSMALTEYEGHRWNSELKEWVKTQARIEQEQREAEQRERMREQAMELKKEQAEQKPPS